MKSANILPLPKINNPKTCGDYRPVSVTPVVVRSLVHYCSKILGTYQSVQSLQIAVRIQERKLH